MINSFNIPSYFYRDYNNDFPKTEEKSSYSSLALRVTKVALPYIALYRPLGMALAGGLGIVRAATSIKDCVTSQTSAQFSWAIFNAMCAVASIAGTVFLHPLGILITTLNDMGVTGYHIYGAMSQAEFIETAKQIMYLANHTFYLAMMMYGSLELQIASLAFQVVVEGILSIEEYQNRHWLEVTGHLIMTAIRVNQLQTKVHLLREKWAVQEAIKSYYVGCLQEKWQFPSDHLPVGIEVNGTKVITWNVLNKTYMQWMHSQGLDGSMLTDLNTVINKEGLTRRDQRVIDILGSMMDPNTGIIALQECGQPFVDALEKSLSGDWKIVRGCDQRITDQEVVLYNSSKFAYSNVGSETSYDAFPTTPGRSIQNVLFHSVDRVGLPLRIINSHIPGDPSLPGRDEFARYFKNQIFSNETTIALGDMNFTREEMERACFDAGIRDFALHSPWQSNIDPRTKKSKAIDHLFVIGDVSTRDLRAEEVAAEEYLLQEAIDLLRIENSGREAIAI